MSERPPRRLRSGSAERPNGFVQIARKLFDGGDLFWPVPFRDRFSRAEAWLDLIQMAAWRDGAAVSGVRLNRGEVCGSLRWFARRWVWTVKAVRWFVQICERTGRIVARSKARTRARTPSVYLLMNYELYNPSRDGKGTGQGTESGTVGARSGHNDEEGKKGRSTDRAPAAPEREPNDLTLSPLASQTTPATDDGRQKRARSRPTRAKTLLPEDWQPNDKHRDIAREEGRDLEREVVRFRDHALATGRLCKDWDAAFRNWLRSDYGRPSGHAAVAGDDVPADPYAGFTDVTEELSP